MSFRLLTNIGRLWTGSEVWSNSAILIHDDRIAWAGSAAQLPSSLPGVIEDIVDVDYVENLGGALVTPGLIEAHAHPVYAGNRWAELAMLSGGASATEILSAGGGLPSTVTVTRGTDPWTLCNQVRSRMREWLLSGTTTIEAKTGYHLTRDGELADVRLLRSLEDEPGMPRVHVTFLAAHALPPEYFGRRHDRAAGLLTRLHAGSDPRLGVARFAADVGCASADLLNGAADADVDALAKAGVAAVVCPAANQENKQPPPVRALLERGVTVALGSGHSPGDNGIASMALVLTLAVANFGMSVTEALRAATVGGARSLRASDRGSIAKGRLADIVAWDADHEGAFAWSYGLKPLRVWRGGEPMMA